MSKITVIGLSGESVFLSVDHFNKPGETINAISKFTEPGGKGYNQAIALGKINADVSFITALGNDPYAKVCIDVLIENNVKVYPIYKDIPSSYATIQTDKNGENHVCVYHGASDVVTFEDIMKYKDVILISDIILLQLEYPIEVTKKVIKFAYENNIKVVLNPAPYNYIEKEYLDMLYCITPNEFELCSMANCDNTNDAINNINVNNIICTQGSKAIIVKENDNITEIKINNVHAIDTTGAGDIFNAFFVYNLENLGIIESSKFASIASTISVTRKGVINSIPSINEVIEFIKNIK